MLTLASISSLYDRAIVDTGRQPDFLFFVSFLITFGFIRTSAHMIKAQVSWWPGNVTVGGTHIHHLVWGIVTIMITGYVGVTIAPPSPWHEIIAVFFGIGMGLALDEFALWLDLKDVYWSEQGRKSVDATVIAAAGMLLLLFGFEPFDFTTSTPGEVISSFAGAALVFAMVAICFAKGRIMHGWIGFFFLPVAIYGAARIGKPDSPWGRRFYTERHPEKRAKAAARFHPDRRTERFKQRFRDIVGGETQQVYDAKLAEERAERAEAAEKMRRNAERVT